MLLSKNRKLAFVIIFFIVSSILGVARLVDAHAYSASFGDLTIDGQNLTLTFSIDELSVIESTGSDSNNDGRLTQVEVDSSQSSITEWMSRNLYIEVGGNIQRAEVGTMTVEQRKDMQVVSVTFSYLLSEDTKEITLIDKFYFDSKDKATYTQFLKVEKNGEISEHLLKGDDRSLTLDVTSENAASTSSSWITFFVLGMEHILTGYDHLLFLLVLLLFKQPFKDYVKIVTAFTIAHSITLTLGYLDVITLSSKLVESAIALSIVYVAVENIIRKEVKHRSLLTFVFGLIHGLGFAGLLSEMEIPKNHLVASLLSFNVGIEVVQIALVALVLPILHFMQKSKHYQKGIKVVSVLMVLVGLYWVIERILG
ncbi:HupE/UreJ family protein [Bacillus timonensis]|nr:HupE/UreJ family protein [Bacillus timonensis]